MMVTLKVTKDKIPAEGVTLVKSRVLFIHIRRKKRSLWKDAGAMGAFPEDAFPLLVFYFFRLVLLETLPFPTIFPACKLE